jgi:hypothetical protein
MHGASSTYQKSTHFASHPLWTHQTTSYVKGPHTCSPPLCLVRTEHLTAPCASRRNQIIYHSRSLQHPSPTREPLKIPMPKQKRKRGHGWTMQKKTPAPPDPALEWWDILAIEGEHEDGRYLVRWDGIDPSTGQPWKRSYVPREHVKGPLVRRWQKQHNRLGEWPLQLTGIYSRS